jgi:hypothetical protein
MKMKKRMILIFLIWFVVCLIPVTGDAIEEGILCIPEPTDMTITYGNIINCSIDTSGDSDLFRFLGTDGETIILQSTWQSGALRPCIELIAPDNTRTEACTNAFLNKIDIRLNQTGMHTIRVWDWFGTNSGKYALALERVIPPSIDTQPVQYGEIITDEINPGGDIDLYKFCGTAGDIIILQSTWQSGALRPCIELIAPDNTRTAACANNFLNKIETTLNQTGVHSILVTDWFGTNSGEYSVDLERIIPPFPGAQPVQYGKKYTGEINLGGEIDLFRFCATAGDTISITATWQDGALRPCIELIAPDNTRTIECNNAFSNSIDTTLNQTGCHIMLITDWFGTNTGKYTLDMQCLAGVCEAKNLGDINGDSIVDITDVILVLRIALGLDPIALCSDINGDGKVDISDVIMILRMALKLDPFQKCSW